MLELIRGLRARGFAMRQGFALGTALLTAEFAFRFGSFVLEAAAFLLTWLLIDIVVALALRSRSAAGHATGARTP